MKYLVIILCLFSLPSQASYECDWVPSNTTPFIPQLVPYYEKPAAIQWVEAAVESATPLWEVVQENSDTILLGDIILLMLE